MNDSQIEKHSIIIENRCKTNISGVKSVISFDDESVLINTNMGKITVKGEGLHIENFSKDIGDLSVDGKINAIVYMSDLKTETNIFSKIFR